MTNFGLSFPIGQLSGFTDEVLSTLFAVKAELCNQKFELKVNDVRFVAHPTLMQSKSGKEEQGSSSILINIVFALYAQASYSIVKCYYELSKRLGSALVFEENRVGYLTDEMRLIMKTHDEIAETIEEGRSLQGITAFDQILERSSLALCLKTVNKTTVQNVFFRNATSFNLDKYFPDISRLMLNWFTEYNDKSIHNAKFLFATKSASISQKRACRRTRSD